MELNVLGRGEYDVFHEYCLGIFLCFQLKKICVYFLQFSESQDSDVELVSCCGYGKNGALTVLQVWSVALVQYTCTYNLII